MKWIRFIALDYRFFRLHLQSPSLFTLYRGVSDLDLYLFTSCFDQLTELHTRWAGSFAGPTTQAAIHMLHKFWRYIHTTIGDRLHLVNTPTRGVHFDTQNCVSWTGRQTEATMNALAH